jgi:uncharacterized membrane protein
MLFRRQRALLPEWVIPLCYALAALAAALTLPRFEARLLPESTAVISTSAALALFSSIASGMIALTGIVFSLAFVMVQFSAIAYSPRLVLWVSRDPVLWHATGIFTATFLYAIGIIPWVDRSGSGQVLFLSGWVLIALMLASVAAFLALIQRIGLLQVNRMLTFTGDHGRKVIERTYPPLDAAPATDHQAEELMHLPLNQVVIYWGEPRALQEIDTAALLRLASAIDAVVEVTACVGDTLIEGMTLLRVFGSNKVVTEAPWRKAFLVGAERTFAQDPKYALRLLVDIAIKALSPAVNDPTTAVQALDQIQDLLFRLGSHNLEIGAMRDKHGILRLVVPEPTWMDFLGLAFDEIRACGATSVQVMRRMKALIADLSLTLPAQRQPALEYQRARLDRSFPDEEAKRDASVEDRQGLGISSGRPTSPGPSGQALRSS